MGPTQNFQHIELMKKVGTIILNDLLDDILNDSTNKQEIK